MYIKSLTEKELRDIAKECIAIINGKSIHAGVRPFYYGRDRLKNQLVFGIEYYNKNIDMFNIIKDWSKRGHYILHAEYCSESVFNIPFTSKFTAKELYILIADKYDKYDKIFLEYDLQLTDNSIQKIRTNWSMDMVKDFYIGKWFKDNQWYSLLPVLDCDIYPKCNNVTMV